MFSTMASGAAIATITLLAAAALAGAAAPLSGCPASCGGVDIPYPFGVGAGCFLDGFEIACRGGKPFLAGTPYQVLSLSLVPGEARVQLPVAWECQNRAGHVVASNQAQVTFNPKGVYRISDTHNELVVVGCNTLAWIQSQKDDTGEYSYSYYTGCVSYCNSTATVVDRKCAGVGCCKVDIPSGLTDNAIAFDGFNHSFIYDFNPCSYAFLIDRDNFTFHRSDLTMDRNRTVPVWLDWAIRPKGVSAYTCSDTVRDPAYACRSTNSGCFDSVNGPGYLCSCSKGYQGNPYLENGCTDINECEDESVNYPCSVPGTCINTPGAFLCSCPANTVGNAYNGTCQATAKISLGVKLAIGISIGLVVLVLSTSCAYLIHQRRKLAIIKQNYFKQHGGLLLFEEMKSKQGLSFTIFTEEELEHATNRFDEARVLGRGGNGTVYKGTLRDNRVVAIKRCKSIDERQKKQFGREMLILSQINHRNIVRLLGCCLEVEVPMLVYEFVPNGTLYQLIHGESPGARISFGTRMRIAHECAEALAYLHSWASPPIFHGDVKSANVLLDESYAAKVSDFGASILAPNDEAQFVTMVQGTCGYLDPEYMQTCQLTDKSDVYSFGVILLELLTCRKAFNLQGPEEEKSLSANFLSAMRGNRLEEILDGQTQGEESFELIEEVAELAKQCLEMACEKRPTMREVAEELDRLRKLAQHPWAHHSPEEIEGLLSGSSKAYEKGVEISNGSYSSEKASPLGIGHGR